MRTYLVHFAVRVDSIERVKQVRTMLSRLDGCEPGLLTLGDGETVVTKRMAEHFEAEEVQHEEE